MATEADIPAPICDTKREESAKIEDQAAIFPPNKLPNEEKIQSDQLHEVPEATESFDLNHETNINKSSEQTFEVEQILGSSSITEVSREANGVSSHSSKVAEKPGGKVNDTEISFVKSDIINDQPLENITSEENSVNGSQENAETTSPFTENVELSEEKVISNDKAVDTQKIEVPNATGDASKEECPGDLNVAVKESSEKTKKDTVSFLKSELTDYPEALKPNDNITERNVVKEEISCDDNTSPGLPVPKESGAEVAENPLPSPLVATSTEVMSSEEVGYDKRNVAGDSNIPAEKLNHKEDTSAETIIEAISDNCGLQEAESSLLQENQYKPLGEIAASQSNPTATEKTGDNSTILVEDGQMKDEECSEKENDNTSLTVATRDEVEDGALKVTHKVKFEEEIALLKEQIDKPKEILHVAVEDIKAPLLSQDTKTTNYLEDGSHDADARDILSGKSEERTADVVAQEETLAVQNVETTFSSEGTEDNSNTEVDESQVKQEECFEKETEDSSQGKAPVTDELKVEDEENALLKEETQTQKHVESLPDASEDIRRAVSSQNVETTIYPKQNLTADSLENLDDQIKDKTVDVLKDESLENIATSVSNEETEKNLATEVDGSEMELDHFKDSEKPSFVENSNRDLQKVPEGLRGPELFANEEITKSTLLKEEAQEEKPVEFSHVTHEHVKASALNPDDGTTNSFEDKVQSAAIVSNEDTVENLLIQVDGSEIEQQEKDCEKTSLTERSMGFTNVGLSAVTHEAETGNGDLRKDEIFCSEKYVGSALLKQEELIEKPIEYLKEAPDVIESSDSNQDIETTSSLKESIESVSKTASNEETEENSLIGVDESQVKNDEHLVKESEEPPVGKDPMAEAASIVSHESKIESTSDLPENTLLKVEADTENSMENTYTIVEQNLTVDLDGTLEHKIEDMAMDKLETKEKPIEIAATFVSNEEIKESSSIQVDDSQIEQDKDSKKESEQQSITESFTRDIKDDDETLIMDKMKNEDLSRAELFQYEGNTECTLIKEEAREEKPLDPLHSAPDDYNSLREDTKAKADEVEPIESFYALNDDKAFGQNIEVAVVQSKAHVAHENDNTLSQDIEVDKDEITQEDKHLESLQVAAEDKELDQCTTVVREKVEEEIVTESLHVVHAGDKTSQVTGESTEVEEDKPSESLHVEYKDDNFSQDMKISKRDAEEEEESMECLDVTCEDDNSFSQDKEIAKTETENETSVKYLNVAPEDDKVLSQKTVAKEETTEEKPMESLGEVYGDHNSLRQEKEILKVDSEEETSNSLYVAPKDDKALSKQFEVAEKETSEEMLVESKHVACEDDNSLSRDKEMAKVYSEVKFANSFDVVPEDDVTLAKEETSEEKLVEFSRIACEDDKSSIQDKEIVMADSEYETSTNSLNVVFDDDKVLSQKAEVANEKAEEEQHVASLHLACEDDNSSGQGKEIADANSEDETSAKSSNVAHEDDTEFNRKIEVSNEKTGEEKFVESLHVAREGDNSLSQDKEIPEANSEEAASAKPLNVADANLEDETSAKSSNVAHEDDTELNRKIEVSNEETGEEKFVESLHVAREGDNSLSQDKEIPEANSEEAASAKPLNVALEDDVALSQKSVQSLLVACEDDDTLNQGDEIAKVDEKEISAKSLNVAPEGDNSLSQDKEIPEANSEEAASAKSSNVAHEDDTEFNRKIEVSNEKTREEKFVESLHVAREGDNSLSQDKEIPEANSEEAASAKPLNVADANLEDETSAKSSNVAHEDDTELNRNIEVSNEETGEEKFVESLHVAREGDNSSSQDKEIPEANSEEAASAKPLNVALEDDVALSQKSVQSLLVACEDDDTLNQGDEIAKVDEKEISAKSLNVAPEGDNSLSQDKEIPEANSEEAASAKSSNVAHEDDTEFNRKIEVSNEKTGEEKFVDSLHVAREGDNSLSQDKEIPEANSEEAASAKPLNVADANLEDETSAKSSNVAHEDDTELNRNIEVSNEETGEEKFVESLHVAREGDNSLSQDKEIPEANSEEAASAKPLNVALEDDVALSQKSVQSLLVACEDDDTLNQGDEIAKVDEKEISAKSLNVAPEGDNSLSQDKEIPEANSEEAASAKSSNVAHEDDTEFNRKIEVSNEKTGEEKFVESLHVAREGDNSLSQDKEIPEANSEEAASAKPLNVADANLEDETSAKSSNVAHEDDTELNRNIEVSNEETGEEKFVESLHVAREGENSLSQDKEIPEANSEEAASAKPLNVALEDDVALSQKSAKSLLVACEDDDTLNQGDEIAKVDEKEISAKSLNVAPQDNKALSQITEVAMEEKPMESLHVVFQDDNSLSQHEEISKVDLEGETSAKSLNVSPEDDDTLSEKAEVANEETGEVKYGESLHVACEEHSSLTCEEKGITNAEPEETSAKSLTIAHEDGYKKIEETKEEIENSMETLLETDEEKALNQDTAISQEESDEETPVSTLHLAPEHDVALHEDTEVVKKEIENENPIELLHVAPKDDEAYSQDNEAVKETTDEERTESFYVALQDNKPLSQDIEAVKEEVEEEKHIDPSHAALEKYKESSQDTTPANEDVEEQHAESSDVATKNDSEYASAKEDENNIVASHQPPEQQSREIKEEVQEDSDMTKTDKDINLQMTDNQHFTTPHPVDTEVTDHGSIDTFQQTTEFDGKNSSGDIANVHVGEKIPSDEKEKTITEIPIQEEIYQESDLNNSTRIIHEGSEEMSNFADISSEQVKEVVSCKDEKRTVEPDTKLPENVDRNMEAEEIIKEEGDLKDLQKITAIAHEEKGTETQYIQNPVTKGSDATEEMVVNTSKDSNCDQEVSSMAKMSKEAQISHDKSPDFTSQVSEASEENSDHKTVEEINCNENTEFKKMEVLDNDSTTIKTKEILVEPETQQIQVPDAIQEGVEEEQPVSASQNVIEAFDITQGTPELEGASQTALNEIKIENRELHTGKTEGLENEEAGTEKDKKEDEAEEKISDCDSGTPILMEAIDKDLSRLAEPLKNVTSEDLREENSFQETDTRESILNDEDNLNQNGREVEDGYISQSKDILASTGIEGVLDSVTQVQNCKESSKAEEAGKEEKFEAAPTEIKPDKIVSGETSKPKETASEAQADMLREKIDKEDHDTENGSCEEEISRISCKENEANQLEDPQIKGEEIFEFIRNPNEDKEVKDSDFVFLDGKENKAEADYIDTAGLLTKNPNSSVVDAAGPELQEKINEDTVPAAAPTELTQKVAEDYDGDEGDTNSTTILLKDETCTSDKVEFKDEKTVMLSAEYIEEKARKVEDLPIDKQVGVAVDHTENANPDSSICNKHNLVPESKDSKESPSLAESEESKAYKETHEEANCGNEERKSDETKSRETSEPIEVPTPSLSDLLHKVSAKETIPTAEKCITEKEPAVHGEQLQAEKSTEETKTGEEKDDEEESGEHHKSDSSSEAPVMVEAGDADVKVAHKKSHHLLSGVGSKVKHSIANIKKAITGKSSHPKPTSPK